MKTAAVYIRVSTDDQIEYSPDAQLREIKKYATNNDMIINDKFVFVDEGISGRSTKSRPAFNKMIGTAKTKPKPFDVILLWKFSRFARNREDAVVYKSMLRKQLGIEVVSVSENIGDDKMSVLIEAFIEAMDEYYSINLAEEVKRGMTEKALRGGLQTTASFGYDKKKEQPMIINELEAPWVKYIFERYLAGDSQWKIAQDLSARGVRTKRGNKFDNRGIEYILNNPIYIGKVRWTPAGKTVGKRIYDSKDTIIKHSDHEPIISEDLFNQVQELLAAKKKSRKKYQKPTELKKHWLSGIVKCSDCGSSLTYQRSTNTFQCYKYAKGQCRHSHSISARKLEEAFIIGIEQVTIDDEFIRANKVVTKTSDTTLMEKQIKRLEGLFERAKIAYLEGIDTIDEYKVNKTKIAKEIDAAKKALDQAQPKEDLPSVEEVQDKIDNLAKLLKSDIDNATKNLAIAQIVDKSTFDKVNNKLDIFFYL